MQKQRGMTLIGMLFSAIVVIMAAIIVMRIVPVYLQHYSIIQSVKSLNSTSASSLSGDLYTDSEFLKRSLGKRLEINDADILKDEQIVIAQKEANKYSIRIKYQVIKPLVYNINLLFNFDDTVEVVVGSES